MYIDELSDKGFQHCSILINLLTSQELPKAPSSAVCSLGNKRDTMNGFGEQKAPSINQRSPRGSSERVNQKTIHVLNTYLQAPYSMDNNDADSIKRSQLEQIRSYMNSLPKEEDIILCGDFNCNGLDKKQYSMISSIIGGKDLLFPKEPTIYLWFNTNGNVDPIFGQSNLPACYDYIFLENQKRLTCEYCRVISSKGLSDHDGIECLFSC